MATRYEITGKLAKEYALAPKKGKGRILDELCARVGWSRANARRQLTAAGQREGLSASLARKSRAPTYGYGTVQVLQLVWSLVGEPCGKYLAAMMETTLPVLEDFGELDSVAFWVTPTVRAQLLAMSPATIDRLPINVFLTVGFDPNVAATIRCLDDRDHLSPTIIISAFGPNYWV